MYLLVSLNFDKQRHYDWSVQMDIDIDLSIGQLELW